MSEIEGYEAPFIGKTGGNVDVVTLNNAIGAAKKMDAETLEAAKQYASGLALGAEVDLSAYETKQDAAAKLAEAMLYANGAAIPDYTQTIPTQYSVINNNTANMRISLQVGGISPARGYYYIAFTAPSLPSSYPLSTFVRINNGQIDILHEAAFILSSALGVTLTISKFFPIDLSKVNQLDVYVNSPYTWDLQQRVTQTRFIPMAS